MFVDLGSVRKSQAPTARSPRVPVELWRFPVTHYGDAVEYLLRWKGIPYTLVKRPPTRYKDAVPATGKDEWPFLLADGKGVFWHDATDWADAVQPTPPAWPADRAEATRARQLVHYFGRVVGHSARRLFFDAARESPGFAMERYRAGGLGRFFVRHVYFPVVARRAGATPWAVGWDEDHFDELFAGRGVVPAPRVGAPLVGDARSAVDIWAATMLGPVLITPRYEKRWGGSPLWQWAVAEHKALRALPKTRVTADEAQEASKPG